jgi:hypothetical protein
VAGPRLHQVGQDLVDLLDPERVTWVQEPPGQVALGLVVQGRVEEVEHRRDPVGGGDVLGAAGHQEGDLAVAGFADRSAGGAVDRELDPLLSIGDRLDGGGELAHVAAPLVEESFWSETDPVNTPVFD